MHTQARSHARARGCTHACARTHTHTHTSRTSMFDGRRLPCARPSRCRYPSPFAAHAVCLHRMGRGGLGLVRGVCGGCVCTCARGCLCAWAHARRADEAVAAGVGRGAPGLSRASRLGPKGFVSLRRADGAVAAAQRLAVHQRRGEEVRRRVLHCYYNFCIIAAIIGVIMIVIMMIIITIMCG